MAVSDSREMLVDVTRATLKERGHRELDIQSLHVPGRIELFGKHTDYCGGRSLLVATEQGLVFSMARRSDACIHIFSADRHQQSEFELSPKLQPTVGDWSNYPMTVARRVARNFPAATCGCDIAVASNLPPAAGMSSSSAMIIGTFLCIDRTNGLSQSDAYREAIRSQQDLSAYLGSIENGSGFRTLAGDRGVGTNGGSQDHTAILCCEANAVSRYAFCPVRHEETISIPANLRFIIGVSGVVAEKTGDALHRYNAVADSVKTILGQFNNESLENSTCLADAIHQSPQSRDRIRNLAAKSQTLSLRFEQFIAESERIIPAATNAIRIGDWHQLGKLADESQRLAEQCLGNQIPESIRLQRAARDCSALASSAFGAGFGGSVWALVPEMDAGSFIDRWRAAVGSGQYFSTRAAGGAHWLHQT